MNSPTEDPTGAPSPSTEPQSRAKRKQVSKRKLQANRRNALKSTGPRTKEGKARSALNALQHGLTAETVVLPDEDPVEFATFRGAIVEELAPHGTLQEFQADRIAVLAWRLRRPVRAEAASARAEYLDERGALNSRRALIRALELRTDWLRLHELTSLYSTHADSIPAAEEAVNSWIRKTFHSDEEPPSPGTDAPSSPQGESSEGPTVPSAVKTAFQALVAWTALRIPLSADNSAVPWTVKAKIDDFASHLAKLGPLILGHELSFPSASDATPVESWAESTPAKSDARYRPGHWRALDPAAGFLRYEVAVSRLLEQALATYERLKEAEKKRKILGS